MSNPESQNVGTNAKREFKAVALTDASTAAKWLNEAFADGYDGYPQIVTIDGRSAVAIVSREKKS